MDKFSFGAGLASGIGAAWAWSRFEAWALPYVAGARLRLEAAEARLKKIRDALR